MGASADTDSGGFEARFSAALTRLPQPGNAGRWIVGFSGGLDSTLLLHALRRAETQRPIVAVHVDHGLHTDSAQWSAHCRSEAERLGVEFIAREVEISRAPRRSLEAEAREARYAALAGIAGAGDVVLTAHHADDQLETVLLRLLRGAGVRGLAAIHGSMPFGAGQLARPLLEFTRAEIEAEAKRLGLHWLEDPSNADTSFDRNFLREECLPKLRERWPGAGAAAGRLARQMAEAESVLGEVAADDLAAAPESDRIPSAVLIRLSEARQSNALRHAIRGLGLPVPNAAQLAELRRILSVRDDAEALVTWPGAEARVYRRHLYLMPPAATLEVPERGRVDCEAAWVFALGDLHLEATGGYGIPDRWARDGLDVRFRAGGERFRPNGSRHRKSLKQWFQEAGIVPWMRGAVPLLYRGDRLVAVADIGIAGDLPQSPEDAPFWRPVWTGHPRLR
jgi:tRNA(Ile)-lysidine synthase